MNIYQKINEVQKQVTSVFKDAEIKLGNNSYEVVTHDAVTSALHMPMANAGIVSIPSIDECQITEFETTTFYQGQEQKRLNYKASLKVTIAFINSDEPEDRFNTTTYSYAFDTGDKAVGKAYSMAIKNVYLKTFMLESKDAEEARPLEDSTYKHPIYKPLTNAAPPHKDSVIDKQQSPLLVPQDFLSDVIDGAINHVGNELGETEITFGKYKGKKFKDLKTMDLQNYIMWMKTDSDKSGKKPSPVIEKGFKWLEYKRNQGKEIPF